MHPIGVREDLHPRGYGRRAGRDEGPRTLDLHEAHAAGAGGGGSFQVAKGGDVDAVALGGLQNRIAGTEGCCLAVERKDVGHGMLLVPWFAKPAWTGMLMSTLT